ncbi:hypothetical protein [Streptomyces sp. Rer75]|uniref:hypothetical protein n=1 Tax=unclassified Streptomyces TaxID=2593676 RepID=UPI0015D03BE9|nr:hypothetical protein HYQ63_31210 [Streptomyces sp. Rer75]
MTQSSVLSDITGAGGRAIINALINGERAPQTLAELAIRRARSKIPALIEALDGTFTEHHAFMCRHYLDEIDHLATVVGQLDTGITALLARMELVAVMHDLSGLNRTLTQFFRVRVPVLRLARQHVPACSRTCNAGGAGT